MNLETQVQRIDERLTKLEENHNEIEKQSIADKYELSALIKEAVLEGNKESIRLFEKIEVKFDKKIVELEKRTCDLENQEARSLLEKRKEVSKIIISTVVGFVALAFISNIAGLISEAIVISNTNDNNIEEVQTNENN